MVIAEAADPQPHQHRAGGRDRQQQQRPGQQGRQPPGDVQRSGKGLPRPVGVGQVDHRRQDHDRPQAAQEDASTGDHPQFGHARKLGQPRHEKRDGRGDRTGENPGTHARRRLRQGLVGRPDMAAEL